jgi:hypothetical protein
VSGGRSPRGAARHALCVPGLVVTAEYRRRDPEHSLLHQIVRENLETFFASADARAPEGRGLPRYVRGAFERYLDCGVLAKGFVRVRCPDCGYDTVVGFS